MTWRQSGYRERMRILRKEAECGSWEAMEELYRRYHINKMMIGNQIVDLKNKFGDPTQGLCK